MFSNDSAGDRLNFRDFARRFGDDRRDRRQSINPKRGKGLKVCLDTRAGTAIRPGYGESNRDLAL